VDNYEYELPSDFEDEEIDEEAAFTAEDKKLYAGWFGDDEGDQEDASGGGSDEDDGQQQRRSKRSKLGEFADLESSSEEEQEGGEEDEVSQANHCCCSDCVLIIAEDKGLYACSTRMFCISKAHHVPVGACHVQHRRLVWLQR
jgi:hypothetical protein